jgi:cyclic pyranopterin phosphate synthase
MNSTVLDTFNRPLRDLRISVTDKCNLRCTYCMPADEYSEEYPFLKREEILTFEEIARIAKAFVELGTEKIRITGGEPLLRRELPNLIAMLSPIPGVKDMALTTNGLLLPQYAQPLNDAGMQRITVSLDSLDDAVFGEMNGRNIGTDGVLAGLEAAEVAGFSPIKINVVSQRGVNDHTLVELVALCRERGWIPRFIEYMDVGNRNRWQPDHVLPSRELLQHIHERWPLRPLDKNYRGETSNRYAFLDGKGEIGFISSVSEPFCGDCTRARLSADGKVYTCLFATTGTDLRGPIRTGASDADLRNLIAGIWHTREDRYSEMRMKLRSENAETRKVEMYHIGG